jgi:hypothetical protein
MTADQTTNKYLLLRNGQLERANIENEAVIKELLFERDSLRIAVNTYEIDKKRKELH